MSWSKTAVTRTAVEASDAITAAMRESGQFSGEQVKEVIEKVAVAISGAIMDLAAPIEMAGKIVQVSSWGHISGDQFGGNFMVEVFPTSDDAIAKVEQASQQKNPANG